MMKFNEQDLTIGFRHASGGQVPSENRSGWISHPYTVFIWNLSGAGETHYRNESLPTVKRSDNTVAYIIAGEERYSITHSAEGVKYLTAGFDYNFRGGFDYLRFFTFPEPLPEEVQGKLRAAIWRLHEQSKMDLPEYRLRATRQVCGWSCLETMLSTGTPIPELIAAYRQFHPVLEELNANFKGELKLDELIRKTPYSRATFFRLFKSHLKMTPWEYMKKLRFQTATRLLLSSDLPIAEVGERSGWPDPFHFSRIFRSSMGVSPLEYRRCRGNII